MDFDDFETTVKVVIVGNGCVGKSSLASCFCKGKGAFSDVYKKTIGVSFSEREDVVGGDDVIIQVWDTAGQEEFKAVNETYIENAGAAILAFSTDDRDSFLAVKKWCAAVRGKCGKIPTVIVQNKVDLLEQAQMDNEEVEALARDLGLKLYRVSCKDMFNVREVFRHLVAKYIRMGGAVAVAELKSNLPKVPVSTDDVVLTDNSTIGAQVATKDLSPANSSVDNNKSSSHATSSGASPAASPSKNASTSNSNGGEEDQMRQYGSPEALKPSKQRTGGKKSRIRCAVQ